MTGPLDRSDEDLAADIAAGDLDSFSVLYRRHTPGLLDFAARELHDREAAADVVQNAFVAAWRTLSGHQANIANTKAWLYAVCRNAAIDEMRRRQRVVAIDEDVWIQLPADPAQQPAEVAADRELAALVWKAASALDPADYSLLDLHLRRQLGPEELAESLGLAKGAVYTRLSRLRDLIGTSVVANVVEKGSRCSRLSELIPTLPAAGRQRQAAIAAHTEECDVCAEYGRHKVPALIFANLAPIIFFEDELALLQQRIEKDIRVSPRSRPRHRHRGQRRFQWWAAGLLTLAALVTILLAMRTSLPTDPLDVASLSHQVGIESSDTVVMVAWTPVASATGYSVDWSNLSNQLPDTTADLLGDASGTTSRPLARGTWWFHLRTGAGGRWTATVHLGPFLIVDPPSPATTTSTTAATTTTAVTTTATTTTTITTTTTTSPPPTTTTAPSR